jgi:glycerol-3-phosphate cytidylyltransferase
MKIIDGLIYDTVGFTCSCFDLLHAGHIIMLKDAKRHCDKLIVGLQTDPTIDRLDTKNKPIQSLEERRIQLEAVKYINEIFEYTTEEELYKKLLDINPDVRILGSDYKGKSFTGDNLDIEIYYHERKHNYSTTNLREKIERQVVSYQSVRSIH